MGKMAPIREELEKLSHSEEEATKGFEHFNEEFRGVFEKVEKKKEEIMRLDNAKNKLFFEIERFNLKKQDLENQCSQMGRSVKDFEDFMKNQSFAPVSGEDMFSLERRMLKLRSEVAAIGDIDRTLLTEARETETRHNFWPASLAIWKKRREILALSLKNWTKR